MLLESYVLENTGYLFIYLFVAVKIAILAAPYYED